MGWGTDLAALKTDAVPVAGSASAPTARGSGLEDSTISLAVLLVALCFMELRTQVKKWMPRVDSASIVVG